MKRCLHCGAPLPDEARFCLCCMKRQKAPMLWPVEKRRYKPKAIKKVAPLVLCAGVIACLLLWGNEPGQAEKHPVVSVSSPDRAASSETDSQRSQESRIESESTVSSSQESHEESGVSAEESGKKPNGMAFPSTVSRPDKSEVSSSQETEGLTTSSNKEEKKMSADELVAAIFENEQAKMANKLPMFVWSEADLGPYSTISETQEIYVAAMTREEWEETSSSDPLLELADVTWRKLRTSECMVGGNSGVYHWEVVTKEEFIDPDYGYEMIHLVVKIQYRVEDQKQTIAGVDTLSMIENVRRELSKTATRVDILPQYEGEGSHTVWCTSSLPFDPTGENPDMPHTQEELERSIVSDFRETFGAYFSPGCLYDVRFLQVEPSEDGTIWFDMGLYIE